MNSKSASLSEARLNAPAGICIVCSPCVTTGELLKWKVIVVSPFGKANGVGRSPVHREIARLDSCRIHRVGQVKMKSVGCVLMTLPQAGVGGGHGKTHQLPIGKGILLGLPLMATRPSVHEVTCLVSIAEP